MISIVTPAHFLFHLNLDPVQELQTKNQPVQLIVLKGLSDRKEHQEHFDTKILHPTLGIED